MDVTESERKGTSSMRSKSTNAGTERTDTRQPRFCCRVHILGDIIEIQRLGCDTGAIKSHCEIRGSGYRHPIRSRTLCGETAEKPPENAQARV